MTHKYNNVNIKITHYNNDYQGGTVVPPYVGMARKQTGGYNASISVQTPIGEFYASEDS